MLVSCWSAKGGSGTTVVAAALASVLGRRTPDGALVVDAAGDLPVVLGLPEPPGPGLTDWLAAGPSVPADALARLEVPARPGLRLLPTGRRPLAHPERAEVLGAVLAGDPRDVVIDAGTLDPLRADGPAGEAAAALARAGAESLLVTRACYLSLRRAARLAVRPTAVVLVAEPDRVLGRHEVEDVVGAPVVAEIAVSRDVARKVDAGTLGASVPRGLERALRRVA